MLGIWLFDNFIFWKSKVKILAEGHIVGSKSWWLTSISFHVNRSSHSWDMSILKIWPWKKSKVKVKAQGHIVGSTSYGLTSLLFHVNWPSHSWNTAFSKFDHENSKSRSWKRSKLKATTSVPLSINSHQFRSMSNGPPIPVVLLFQHLTLKFQGEGHKPMMLHNDRSCPPARTGTISLQPGGLRGKKIISE